MKQIEGAWFGKKSTCPESSPSISSNSLSLKSFWGLFLIAGLAALLALIIFVVMFVYRERNVLRSSDSTASIWSRIENFFRIFIQRDSTSSTFRQSDLNDRNGISLPAMCAPSPSSYSVQISCQSIFCKLLFQSKQGSTSRASHRYRSISLPTEIRRDRQLWKQTMKIIDSQVII